MKNFISSKDEIARVNTVFAMILVMVGIAYYYLFNLTTELVWVVMCGFAFVAISSLFTLLYGAASKRTNIVFLAVEFLLLGVLGFAAKLLQGIGQFTMYSYLYAAAYALSGVFVFANIDKVAFGKNLLTKWWFVVIMFVLSIVPTVLLYVLPEYLVNLLIIIENVINAVIYLCAFVLGVYCIIKGKNKLFSWTYTVYAFLITIAYVFQLFSAVRWFNLFLMLGLIAVPFILMNGVKTAE